jgi:hypothetical protein
MTPDNARYGGVNVVDVPEVDPSSGAPDANTPGVLRVDAGTLAAGQSLVQGASQFFHFTGGSSGDNDYGVVRLYLGGAAVDGSVSWTPAIPDDGNNGAQASGSIVITVPDGGADLSARAVIRGGGADGQAGGSLIVTKLG